MYDYNLNQVYHLLKYYYNFANHKIYYYVIVILNDILKKEYQIQIL